nr:immunoglobulin heavy chain junction region [Macaca mulatta]
CARLGFGVVLDVW